MRLSVRLERWPVRGVFRIARGEVREVDCLVVEIEHDGVVGRGEASPDRDMGTDGLRSLALVESVRPALEAGAGREDLQSLLPACPARNAIDCALWDFEAKRSRTPVVELAGLAPLRPVETVFTLSLDAPEAMAASARERRSFPVLKMKLAGSGDLERVRAVRAAAPANRLVVDANESWPPGEVGVLLEQMAKLGVSMVEQPLPKGGDALLGRIARPLPVCADESCQGLADLPRLTGRYDLINVKLDKTGGLTEALALANEARMAGMGIMVGCMVGTSLAMAPAHLVAQMASVVDIDGPLLLAKDRRPGLRYEGAIVHPPEPELWG